MKRNEIIEALEHKGYQAKAQDVIKNGVTRKGIMINTGTTIAPIIYPKHIMDADDTPETIADKILKIYEEYRDSPISPDTLTDRDWILEHLFIALQRTSDEELVKKDTEFEGIEQYLILVHENPAGFFSIKISHGLLANADIDEDEAWTIAMIHLVNRTRITSLKEILGMACPVPTEDFENVNMELYVVTTTHKFKGASAILSRSVLSDFAKEHNTDRLIVIPSSIHETLIMPYTGDQNIDEISEIVREINGSEVAPEEQLSDRAYMMNV